MVEASRCSAVACGRISSTIWLTVAVLPSVFLAITSGPSPVTGLMMMLCAVTRLNAATNARTKADLRNMVGSPIESNVGK